MKKFIKISGYIALACYIGFLILLLNSLIWEFKENYIFDLIRNSVGTIGSVFGGIWFFFSVYNEFK